MNVTPLNTRRAIRAYQAPYREAIREAIRAAEREAAQRAQEQPQPPEPCNFCAPPDDPAPVDRFAELAEALGPWWLLWIAAYVAVAVVGSVLAADMLVSWVMA